jgi:pilus assembly protein TadC
MATGLFTHRSHNQGRSFAVYRAQQRRERRDEASARLDAFAELLAEGMEPADAAVRVGCSKGYGRTMLQRIVTQLGKEQCR